MGQSRPVQNSDGGHHAIRGFAFQFDATMLEAWADPETVIGIEGDQDIDVEDFYIQVKLRSQTFSLSRITKAVKQLIDQFSGNTDRRYRLYCYFKDQEPGMVLQFDDEQLDHVLGMAGRTYSDETKKLFIDRFEIKFAPDFEAQFSAVLEQLISRHSLRTVEEAVAYHAVLYQHLTTLVLSKCPGSRTTSASQLDTAVRCAERAIFQGGYQNHLGKQKYAALLRSQIVSAKSVNMVWRQRLVIVEAGSECHTQDIVDLAAGVSGRFYVRNNSPQPFLLLRGVADLCGFKRALWDAKVMFTDGTHFDGDRFRIEDLTGSTSQSICLRLVDESKLSELMRAVNLQDIYEFYSTRPIAESFEGSRLYRMAVDSVADAVRVMEVGRRA
jgi:hypothetical protein